MTHGDMALWMWVGIAAPATWSVATDHRLSSAIFGFDGNPATWTTTPVLFTGTPGQSATAYAELRSSGTPYVDRPIDLVAVDSVMYGGVALNPSDSAAPLSAAAIQWLEEMPFVPLYEDGSNVVYLVVALGDPGRIGRERSVLRPHRDRDVALPREGPDQALGPGELHPLPGSDRPVGFIDPEEVEPPEQDAAGAHVLGEEDGPVPVRESADVDDSPAGGTRPRAHELPRELGDPLGDGALVVPVGMHDDHAPALVRRDLGRDGAVQVGDDHVRHDPRSQTRRGCPVGRDHREGIRSGGTSPEGGRPGAGGEPDDDDLPTGQLSTDTLERPFEGGLRKDPLQAGQGGLFPVEWEAELHADARVVGGPVGILHGGANPANAL